MTIEQKPDLSHLFLPDAAWRDLIAFNWDFHTVYGLDAIRNYLTDPQGQNKLKKGEFKVLNDLKAVKEVQAGPGMLHFTSRLLIPHSDYARSSQIFLGFRQYFPLRPK